MEHSGAEFDIEKAIAEVSGPAVGRSNRPTQQLTLSQGADRSADA
jgi:hypothetical protein